MTITEPHGFARVAWLVLAMAMATLPFVGALPPWLTLGIIALATWRLVSEHRGLVVVPILSVRLLLVVIVGILLLLGGDIGFGLAAATPLFVGLLWSKLLELKARRDFIIACVLCYFLVAVLLFDRQSLFTCLYAVASLGMITIALVSYHRGDGARSSFALGLRLLLQGLPLAAALFVLFPRLQINFPNLGGQATSGFADRLTPGDVARMALSDGVVMRVEFPNHDRPEQLYWRGLVLSETVGATGATWRVANKTIVYPETPEPRIAGLATVVQDITLQPLNQRWLFALDVAEQPPDKTRLAFNRCLQRGATPTQVLHYRVTSRPGELPSDDDGIGSPLPPEIDPRVRRLAQDWRSGASGARAIAERGLEWFRSNGFTYSLAPGTMEGDQAADFLFEKRSGFCAHYATAFALVLRIAGVPARVVVGFRGGELNPFGDFLLVRYEHAHAWCEVHDHEGWHRIDPTVGIPPAPGETQPAVQRAASGDQLSGSDRSPAWLPEWLRGPYARTNQWLAFADAKWETSVMGMDSTRQEEWLARLGLQRFGNWLLVGLIVLCLGAAALWFAIWSSRNPQRRAPDPVGDAYAEFCQRLARLGVERHPSEGPRDFTTRAAAALPALAAAIQAVGAVYEQVRYGAAPDAAAGLTRLRAAIRALPRAVRPAVTGSSASGEAS